MDVLCVSCTSVARYIYHATFFFSGKTNCPGMIYMYFTSIGTYFRERRCGSLIVYTLKVAETKGLRKISGPIQSTGATTNTNAGYTGF